MCILYHSNSDTGDLLPIISDLAAEVQLGKVALGGELDRLIGVLLGYHCARDIHTVPSHVEYSINVSLPESDEKFQIFGYGCPEESEIQKYLYYGSRMLKMHFKMTEYLKQIGLQLSITTEINSH